jgi:hypothetical protein
VTELAAGYFLAINLNHLRPHKGKRHVFDDESQRLLCGGSHPFIVQRETMVDLQTEAWIECRRCRRSYLRRTRQVPLAMAVPPRDRPPWLVKRRSGGRLREEG